MYDSGVSVKELVERVKKEADIAYEISNADCLIILNSLEQLLYTGIIKEQGTISMPCPDNGIIRLSLVDIPEDESAIRFEDICTVYADDNQLIKTNAASADVFPNIWYRKGIDLAMGTDFEPDIITIVYYVKPALKKTNDNDVIQSGNIMLPYEFVEIAAAKLRGEMYKIANEDVLSAKWINDYNALVETFKLWVSERHASFGC
ncbi:MAG: hypothetical protein J6N52_03720 [Clostridia bacterium]|nr:hypothetical protein [Clostridia bacterium]